MCVHKCYNTAICAAIQLYIKTQNDWALLLKSILAFDNKKRIAHSFMIFSLIKSKSK